MKLGLASNFQDEFHNIEGIWKLFKDVVDQWLVIDSGSMDNTPWKLKEVVGDKLKLIQSPMVRDHGFAFARTKLIEASEGMDWILTIDGDERMCPFDAKKLKDMIDEDPPYDIIWLPRIAVFDREMRWIEYDQGRLPPGSDKFEAIKLHPDWQARVIRRTMINGRSKVRFKRAVHEVPIYEGVELRERRDLTDPIIESFGRLKTLERRQMIGQLCRDLQQKFPEGLEEFGDKIYND